VRDTEAVVRDMDCAILSEEETNHIQKLNVAIAKDDDLHDNCFTYSVFCRDVGRLNEGKVLFGFTTDLELSEGYYRNHLEGEDYHHPRRYLWIVQFKMSFYGFVDVFREICEAVRPYEVDGIKNYSADLPADLILDVLFQNYYDGDLDLEFPVDQPEWQTQFLPTDHFPFVKCWNVDEIANWQNDFFRVPHGDKLEKDCVRTNELIFSSIHPNNEDFVDELSTGNDAQDWVISAIEEGNNTFIRQSFDLLASIRVLAQINRYKYHPACGRCHKRCDCNFAYVNGKLHCPDCILGAILDKKKNAINEGYSFMLPPSIGDSEFFQHSKKLFINDNCDLDKFFTTLHKLLRGESVTEAENDVYMSKDKRCCLCGDFYCTGAKASPVADGECCSYCYGEVVKPKLDEIENEKRLMRKIEQEKKAREKELEIVRKREDNRIKQQQQNLANRLPFTLEIYDHLASQFFKADPFPVNHRGLPPDYSPRYTPQQFGAKISTWKTKHQLVLPYLTDKGKLKACYYDDYKQFQNQEKTPRHKKTDKK
jgi:hypothetical protein